MTEFTRDQIDALWPPCGPCAFCGGPDKRHRMLDRHMSGEPVSSIAEDYGVTPEHVLAALAWTKANPTPVV